MREIARMLLTFKGKQDDPRMGRFGAYLGHGDGDITGDMITGRVFWDLYEEQGPRSCDANLVGAIVTQEAAVIEFEVMGFFKRREGTDYWDLASAVRFRTDDPRYGCFDHCVGHISGHFDMKTYAHDYRLFAPSCRV